MASVAEQQTSQQLVSEILNYHFYDGESLKDKVHYFLRFLYTVDGEMIQEWGDDWRKSKEVPQKIQESAEMVMKLLPWSHTYAYEMEQYVSSKYSARFPEKSLSSLQQIFRFLSSYNQNEADACFRIVEGKQNPGEMGYEKEVPECTIKYMDELSTTHAELAADYRRLVAMVENIIVGPNTQPNRPAVPSMSP